MTTIVAVNDMGSAQIWMGADRQATSGWERTDNDFEKIFQPTPLTLCAITGKSLLKQVLEFGQIDWSRLDRVDPKNFKSWFVSTWAPMVRAALKAEGMNPRDIEGQIMIVTRGHVVIVDSNLAIRVYNNRSVKDTFAIGSGSSYALGALFATTGQHPRWRIETALAAAGAYDICTGDTRVDIRPEPKIEPQTGDVIDEDERVIEYKKIGL